MYSPEVSRRNFNRGLMALGALAAVGELEGVITEHYYPVDETRTYVLPQSLPLFRERRLRFEANDSLDLVAAGVNTLLFDEMIATVQGIGRQHGLPYAQMMGVNAFDIPWNKRPMSYFNYSSNGITVDDLATHLAVPYRMSRSASYSGISIGSPNGLEGHRGLAARGIVVPIRRFVEVCSPKKLDHLTDPVLARFAAVFAQILEGGVFTKMTTGVVELARLDAAGKDASMLDKLRWLVHNTTHGSPPRLGNSQMRMFAQSDFDSPLYRTFIGPYTEAILVACAHPGDDKIVKCRQSRDDWARWFEGMGAQVTLVDNPPGVGHANTEFASQRVRPVLASSYKGE